MHQGKVSTLQQLLAKAQLDMDAVASEASGLRSRVHVLQQEAASKASAAHTASAAALQAQEVR